MSGVAVALMLTLAALLLISAATKAVHPAVTRTALVEFGLPREAAGGLVAAGVITESGVAVALVLSPHNVLALAACLILFGVFGAVAAVALKSGRRIECGCFGGLHRSVLGWTQVVQFALVVPSVLVVSRFAPNWNLTTGLVVLLGTQVAVGWVLLSRASADWRRVRRDRVSLSSARAAVRLARSLEGSAVGQGGEA